MNPFEIHIIRVTDQLTENTRSLRKSLLITSTVAAAISETGLIPTRISTLGIEFSQTDRGSMLILLSIVVSFLLLSFIVVAIADFMAWWISLSAKSWDEELHVYENVRKEMLEREIISDTIREQLSEIDRRQGAMWRNSGHINKYIRIQKITPVVSWIRVFIEFVCPIIAGVTVLIMLFIHGWT